MYNMRRQRTCVDHFLHMWTRQKNSFYCCDGSIKRRLSVSIPVQFPRSADASFSSTNSSFSQSRLGLRAGAN